MKKVYIATVQIAVEAEDNPTACDAISECLTHNLMHNGAILDWSYVPVNGVFLEPEYAGEVDIEKYEESTIFQN